MLLFSCQNNDLEIAQEIPQSSTADDSKITYPLTNTTTRGNNELDNAWEDLLELNLPSGVLVYTPWNPNISSKTIPTDYSNDIKKVDGWRLIAHTMNSAERGLNYLLFYNRFTGILKAFYYLEESYSQSMGLWHIHIDQPQNLLSFTGNYAEPTNSSNKIQDAYCSNITINEDKAYTKGWNCFEFELAYDPDFNNGTLFIEPCGIIKSELNITGNYNSKSTGTIIAMNANKKEGSLKGSGSDAKNHIINESSKVSKSYSDLSSLTKSSPISDFIKKGVNALFKSFTAKTKKDKPQEYKLQYTTNGTVTLNGNITTNIYGGFSPISINISKDKVGSLGVWNLVAQPTIGFNTLGRLVKASPNHLPIFRIYGIGKDEYSIIINPNIKNEIIDYSSTYEVFTTKSNKSASGSSGSLSGGMNYSGTGAVIYEDLCLDRSVEFKVAFPTLSNQSTNIPGMIYLYGSTNEDNMPFGIYNNYIFKVSLLLNINNNDETISTKSFSPKLEWRKDNLDQNSHHAERYDYFILQQL